MPRHTIALSEKQEKELAVALASAKNASGMKTAFSDLMIEVVEPKQLTLDVISAFMPVRELQPGDELGRRVKKGRYPVYSMTPGSNHLTAVTALVDQYIYAFDRIIAGTHANIMEIESGDVGTVADMRTDLRAALFNEIVTRVFTLLTSTWTEAAHPTRYEDLSGVLTSTGLDAMIEAMEDDGLNVRTIIGTNKALRPLHKFAQYRQFELSGTATDRVAYPIEATFNEFTNTRSVSRYDNIAVITLPQMRRDIVPTYGTAAISKTDLLLPDDKVLVLADTPGEVVLYGDTDYQDYTDFRVQPANYVVHAWQNFALLLDDVESVGVLKLTHS